MLRPSLGDTVERITRDPGRKLGWNDRLVGTMRLALRQGIVPRRYARGAAAALRMLGEQETDGPGPLLERLWSPERPDPDEKEQIKALILSGNPDS
jgi:mannitol-1-phosphate 5-dehydrogenase